LSTLTAFLFPGVWSWFPIGPAGFRTGVLFLCGLLVIILRIAQYHVGIRTSTSRFHALTQNLLRLSTYETFLWYFVSASLFVPVFLWAHAGTNDLHWIVYKNGDRPRLNEKPLFLGSYLVLACASCQAGKHLWRDEDQLRLGCLPPVDGQKDAAKKLGDGSKGVNQVLKQMPAVFIDSATLAAGTCILYVPFYILVVRTVAWRWALFFFRWFYALPKTNMVPPYTPLSFFILLRCFLASFMLFVIWRTGNSAFSTFMVREPLKNGKPLTSDSKDPNGSLLNGLKSKRPSIRVCIQLLLCPVNLDTDYS
jgi:nucleoporin NDC1